jgi:hypothetical protein
VPRYKKKTGERRMANNFKTVTVELDRKNWEKFKAKVKDCRLFANSALRQLIKRVNDNEITLNPGD